MTSLSLLEIAVLHINCLCHTVFLKCGWNALTIGCNHLRSQILNKYFPWEDICDLLVYNEKLDLNSFHPYIHMHALRLTLQSFSYLVKVILIVQTVDAAVFTVPLNPKTQQPALIGWNSLTG